MGKESESIKTFGVSPPADSESKLKKRLPPDHSGGKNDRKSRTPTVFQRLRLRLTTCRARVCDHGLRGEFTGERSFSQPA